MPAVLTPGAAWRRGLTATASEWDGGRGTAEAPYADLTECRISGGVYDAITLPHASVRDVELIAVATVSMSLRGSHVRRLRIDGGRIGTLDLADADIDELIISGARIDYLSLGRAQVADAVISASAIGTLDAPAAKLVRVTFDQTRVDELDLREARNTDVDLRGLDVAHHLDPRGLAGVTMTELQVQLIARELASGAGIDVRG